MVQIKKKKSQIKKIITYILIYKIYRMLKKSSITILVNKITLTYLSYKFHFFTN